MVAQRFTRAVEANDSDLVARMRDSIHARIEALDEFYLQNDDDEQNRGMLFEKQRLQLRRLLQSAEASPRGGGSASAYGGSPAAASPPPFGRSQRTSPARSPQRRTAPSPRGSTSKVEAAVSYSTRSPKRGALTKKEDSRLPWSPAQKSGAKGRAKPKSASKRVGGTPRRTKALYAWETGAQGRISKREPEEAAFDPAEAAMIQFRVVMTKQEYRAFQKTYRQKRAMYKHIQKNTPSKAREAHLAYTESQASINASGPYVDPAQLEKRVYRGEDREAWVDPSGMTFKSFTPIGEIPTRESLPAFAP